MKSKAHKPAFRWKDNVIYDGDDAIAKLSVGRHIYLDAVKLTPGGEPHIGCWNLSWRQGGICTTSKIQKLEARNSGPANLHLALTANTADDGFTADTRIDLSFDSQRQCYRYDTLTSLRINKFPFYSWKEIDSPAFSEFGAKFPQEFANFLPAQSYSYWAPADPIPKRYQAFVYQNAAGGWSWVPQHHLNTPDKYDICFPAGRCRLGFVDDPAGNPCIELIDRLPATSRGGICWAMNDIHMLVEKIAVSNLNTYRVKYALFLFNARETAEILKKARGHVYTEEEKNAYDRPRLIHQGQCDFSCDFESGYDLEKPDDNFRFWMPMGDIRYASWARGEGRGGGRCLKQDAPAPARVLWQLEATNAPVVVAGKRYRVAAWIKTENLEGKAFIEAWDYDCKSPHNPLPDSPARSKVISGSSDWQEVAVEVDVVKGVRFSDNIRGKLFVGKIALRLVHEGQGKSWFDDVSIREA